MSEGKEPTRGAQKEPELLALQPGRHRPEGKEPPRVAPREPELLARPSDRVMAEGKEPLRSGQKERELLGLRSDQSSDRDRNGSGGKEPPRGGQKERELLGLRSDQSSDRDRDGAGGKELPRGGQKERELLGLRSDQSSDRDRDRDGSGGKEPPRGGQMERELLGLRSDQSSDRDRDESRGKEPPRGGQLERELLGLRSDQSSDRDRDGSGGKEPPRGGQNEPEARPSGASESEGTEPPRRGPREPELRLLPSAGDRSERRELPRIGPKALELLVPAACLARVLKQVAEEDVPLKGFPGLPSFSSGSGLLTLEEALNLGDADLAHLLGLADDEDKCRQIRKQYRQLIQNVQQNREDIVNASSDSLTEALEEANALFDTVSRTREAALDAQFLVLASDLGKEKAKQLTSDMSFFNQVAFCDFLLLFVGLNLLEADREDALSDCDETMAHTFWETVHKEATSWILRADTFHFMFGSFKTDAAAPKRRVEHKRKAPKAEESGDMPTKLRRMDLSCNQEATEKEVERILGLLQTYFRKYPDTPVSYFEFVIDPTSFSRTVENIFYVSFIIRDGFARISLDQDRLPILEPIDIDQMGEGSDFSFHSRKQGIISLSLQDWKNIVATFEISEAMIKKY